MNKNEKKASHASSLVIYTAQRLLAVLIFKGISGEETAASRVASGQIKVEMHTQQRNKAAYLIWKIRR